MGWSSINLASLVGDEADERVRVNMALTSNTHSLLHFLDREPEGEGRNAVRANDDDDQDHGLCHREEGRSYTA